MRISLIETPEKPMNVDEHSSIYIANGLSFAHDAMIRSINSIYTQAPHVEKSEDITDFLSFIKSWAEWVIDHHHLTGTKIFPGFEEVIGKPGFLQTNIEQHHAFEPGLKKLMAFAHDTKPEGYKFDTLQSIINRFMIALQEPLHDEIPTLITTRPYDSEGLSKLYQDCEEAAGEQDKTVVPPMVLGLCDKTFQL